MVCTSQSGSPLAFAYTGNPLASDSLCAFVPEWYAANSPGG